MLLLKINVIEQLNNICFFKDLWFYGKQEIYYKKMSIGNHS